MRLPERFATLEPFAQDWIAPSADARAALRGRASAAALASFYEAVQPRLEEALDYLDGRPLTEQTLPERDLMLLLLAYAHVAMAIEVQGPDEPAHARLREHMPILRAPADAD